MSHVPLNRHQEACQHLEAVLDTFRQEAHNSQADHMLFNKLRQYYDYFERVWMDGRFNTTEWNFFDMADNTTTNAAESTNWRFQVW